MAKDLTKSVHRINDAGSSGRCNAW